MDRAYRILGKSGLKEGEKQSGTSSRLATLCGQNARLGGGALRGWTRPSYSLPLGSKKVIFNRELIIQHNEATESAAPPPDQNSPITDVMQQTVKATNKPTIDIQKKRNVLQK